MSQEMKSKTWPDRFESIAKNADSATGLLHSLAKVLIADTESEEEILDVDLREKVSRIFRDLDEALANIEKTNGELRDYFCSLPVRKLLTGLPLTRQEFYLLAAAGAITIPSESGEGPYREFMYYLYEDNEQCGYINLSETHSEQWANVEAKGWETEPRVTLGVMPEDVDINYLGDDQKAFLKKHRPKLYARFKAE
ncbi:MAG: hypothetical protein SWH78_15550 [Thermodesulfobacteriota bacterium]|nr:hypothetical protein [Thermodesulfobacteriota bacterium]